MSDCRWCGSPASERVVVEAARDTAQGYRAAVTAPACAKCSRRLCPPPPEPDPEPIEERVPPLCDSCFGEISFVRVVKDGRVNGRKMPVDRLPIHRAELRHGYVVVNPRTNAGVVLTKALLEVARGWLSAGARLHQHHRATCGKR